MACPVQMLLQLACSSFSSMNYITNLLLLLLIVIQTNWFVAGGALQPQHDHDGGCVPAERDALLFFKKGIRHDGAGLLTSWHGQDCCCWRGVECSNQSGQVVKLHLRSPTPDIFDDVCYAANALYGEISPSLFSLKYLEHIDLSMNCLQGLNGSIPHFLGSLENLRYLNISGIPFTSRVPSQLGNLSKLQYLDLGQTTGSEMYSTDITWLTKLPLLQHLSMSRVNLSGIADWPRMLNMIPSLRVISLPGCSLDSPNNNLNKTTNLKNLCSLEILDLSQNNLKGGLTEWLPKCKRNKLQELNFGINSFTGTIPNFIEQFTSLRILDISNNQLVGPIPPGLWNVKCLTNLQLSFNQLSGSLPTKIGSLPNLSNLNLANNNLCGVIREEHLAGLKSLKYIGLSFNNLKVLVDPEWLPPFRLQGAWFASCQMGPQFPAWLQHQGEITTIDISSNGLKGEIPDWFWSTFSQATELKIANNQISGTLPAHSLATNITWLDISNNTFSGTLPSNLEASQLQILFIYSNQIGGYIPESICKLQQLLYLDMSNNILEGEIPQCFDRHNIRFLLLSNNSLSGKFPTFLKNNPDLEFLDLSWNKFSGRLPTWIRELGNLRFLLLGHNIFSDNIPVEITNLEYLQYLDLSGNNFSGAIPWYLTNLRFMKTVHDKLPLYIGIYLPETINARKQFIYFDYLRDILLVITKGQRLIYGRTLAYFVSIDLSDNSLTGEIPTDITSLDGLINLNLSSNQLSGQIPRMIGAMQSLVSLDLSKNKISGEIPSSVSNLSSLSYLNLSYNSLSGRIPSGRQLDTLNADNPSLMYIGNSGLCGPPLQKNCSGNDINHDHLSGSKQEFEPMTFYFGLVMGLVAGHWMVFCALLFKKTWRIAYFRFFDKLYDMIYVFVVLNWGSFMKNTTTK